MFDESFRQAWRLRYGSEPEFEVPEIARLLAHRSVREYTGQAVPEETAKALVAAAQSAGTSSNLQLWSVISVQDPARRDAIAHLCGDQPQIRECAWFFAFLADHYRMRRAALHEPEGGAGLGYTEFFVMAVVDAALACERMVVAAEALGFGISYIGALRNDPEGVKELLGLPAGVFGVFGLCVGWPKSPSTAEIKPRLRQEAVWFRERYDLAPNTQEYDERMRGFYQSQGMRGDFAWSRRSGRRTDRNHLTGREVLRDWLRAQGFELE